MKQVRKPQDDSTAETNMLATMHALRLKAQQEEVDAQFKKGFSFYQKKDYDNAKKYLELAAEQELAIAQLYLGFVYHAAYKERQPDAKKINLGPSDESGWNDFFSELKMNDQFFHWFSRGTANLVLENNWTDIAEAFFRDQNFLSFLREEAIAGRSMAQVILAHLYQIGKGVRQDLQQASAWMTKAAEKQDLIAMYDLGVMFMRGEGVASNLETASKLFQEVIEVIKGDKRFSVSALKRSLEDPYGEGKDYPQYLKQWLGLLALERLRFIQEQTEQQRLQKAKEETEKQMLSFLTHTLNNTLVGTSQKVRDTVRYLLNSDYEKDKRLYDTVNEVASLQTTLAVIQTLIQTFKQSINDPNRFQQSWQQDHHGEGTLEWVMVFALAQTLGRIFFHETGELPIAMAKKLLSNNNADLNFKQLRHSFLAEVMTLELTSQNIQPIFDWVKQHFDIFIFDLDKTRSIHFTPTGTRFTFLFAILSEILYNALKYSDGQSKITLSWHSTADSYELICANTFNLDWRHEQQETQKGLVFIKRLMQMLQNSSSAVTEEENLFTVKLVFAKINFEEDTT